MSSGRAFVFGDDIDTDVLAPGAYMKFSIDVLARHCMEALDATFATSVATGDIVVAGRAFGLGSSREQAAQALKFLGVRCVLARSFGGIFYRNAINLGLPLLTWPATASVRAGDRLGVEIRTGVIVNETTGLRSIAEPLPPALLEIVDAGGLIPHLEQRLARTQRAPSTAPAA